jgi:transcriptional/translational regulatory protein YebC/TACO1
VILIDRLLAGGIRFVFDKLAAVADAELNDASKLREELLEAQMSLELGDIDEEEFLVVEARVLERLREIRSVEEAAAEDMEIAGIEVSVDPSVRAGE